MDLCARDSCLRAIRLVARSARLCAAVGKSTPQHLTASASAERMLGRARGYFRLMQEGHRPTERVVRLVSTALTHAEECVLALTSAESDPDDLLFLAEKIERDIERAGPAGSVIPPPAS